MKKNLPNIDDLFRSGIEGHEEEVPDGIWDKIDNQLDKKQAISFRQKYYRIRRLAVALLLLGVVGSVYALYTYISSHRAGNVAVTTDKAPGKNNTDYKIKPLAEKHQAQEEPIVKGYSLKDNSKKTVEANNKRGASVNGQAKTNRLKLPVIAETGQSSDKAASERNTANFTKRKDKNAADKTDKDKIMSNMLAGDQPEKNEVASRAEKEVDLKENNTTLQQKETLQNAHAASGAGLLPGSPLLSRAMLLNRPLAIAERSNVSVGAAASAATGGRRRGSRLSLTAFASMDIDKDRLQNNNRFARPGQNREEAKRTETHSTASSAGLRLSYELNKKWSISSGLIFSSSTSTIAGRTIYAKPDGRGHIRYEFHCSSGYSYIEAKMPAGPTAPPPDSLQAAGTKSRLQYLSLPVMVQYKIGNGKFFLKPGAGLAANFLTGGKVATTISSPASGLHSNSHSAITGLKESTLSGILSLDAGYRLNKSLSLNFIPMARLGLTTINKNTPVKTYQNLFSLAGGITLNL